MLDANHFDDLRDFLKSCIHAIKKNYPHASSTQLAKKIDITQSSFARIENKDTKRPSFNTAIKVAREACGETRVQQFIEKFYPEMLNTMNRIYPGNSDVDFVVPEAEAYFEDGQTFELMLMATSREGVNREKVQVEFGRRGSITLEKLLEKGILKEENGKILYGNTVNAAQTTVHKLLQNLVSMSYDVDAFGDKLNWLSVQYESVDLDKAMPMLREIIKKANQEIREVLNSPENAGDDVVWAGLAMDSLAKKAIENGGQARELLQ